KGQKYFYYVVLLIFIVLAFKGQFKKLSCFSFIVITPMLTRHRGMFHSVWFVVLMPLLIYIAMASIFPELSRPFLLNAFFFIAGALSHIFLDRGFSRMFRYRRR